MKATHDWVLYRARMICLMCDLLKLSNEAYYWSIWLVYNDTIISLHVLWTQGKIGKIRSKIECLCWVLTAGIDFHWDYSVHWTFQQQQALSLK